MSTAPPTAPLLEDIRASLIRQEETIIFALIERSQWKRNVVCYEPGAAAYGPLLRGATADLSFLDYMLSETERLHSRVRRYTSPDEYPFFADRLPPPELPLLEFPPLLGDKTQFDDFDNVQVLNANQDWTIEFALPWSERLGKRCWVILPDRKEGEVARQAHQRLAARLLAHDDIRIECDRGHRRRAKVGAEAADNTANRD